MRRREAETKRRTNETEIFLSLDLDGEGAGAVDSGVGFLNHMLDLFKTHSGINLSVVCRGDTEVDDHHSTEDVAIALGETFREALGDRKGIERFADCVVPMGISPSTVPTLQTENAARSTWSSWRNFCGRFATAAE